MKVAILGAGSAAFGIAAYLVNEGHEPMIWSPSGGGTEGLATGTPLVASNALELCFTPAVAASCPDAVEWSDILIIAVPAYGHKSVMDAVAPNLRDGQCVIISSHASFSALYLSKLAAARNVSITIVFWGTTLTTGRKTSPNTVNLHTIRTKIDLATVPHSAAHKGLSVCRELFGDRFVEREGMIAIALSNLNPQGHLSIVLFNLTRAERSEAWQQGEMVTPAVGRLMEALDTERLAIAAAYGVSVRTVFEHFVLSYQVAPGTVSEMNQELQRLGKGGFGPTNLSSRYITEDVPFGLACTALLGRKIGVPAVLHEAGIALLSAALGEDLPASNDILPELGLNNMSASDLEALLSTGY